MFTRFRPLFRTPHRLLYSTMPVTQQIKIGSKSVDVPTGLYINGEWVRSISLSIPPLSLSLISLSMGAGRSQGWIDIRSTQPSNRKTPDERIPREDCRRRPRGQSSSHGVQDDLGQELDPE